MTEIDGFLEDLRKMIKDYKRIYYEHESELPQRIETYENILKSKKSSKELKVVASLSTVSEYSDQARRAGEISVLYTLQRLALNVKILQISIDNLNEQLVKSGILEKVKDIEDIKKLKNDLDKFTKLLKAAHEKRKKIEETRKKDLSYID